MHNERQGVLYAVAAYGLWGLFPLYFVLFAASSALEVVAHRVVWTLVFSLLAITLLGQWGQIRAIVQNRRSLAFLAFAGVLILGNWTGYVYGVSSGHTLEAAMGYFINPLAVAAGGVLLLQEKLRPLQWLAILLGVVAVIVLVVAYGKVPWIALLLAATFGGYSLVKKVAGATVGPLPGLAIETSAVVLLAIGYLGYLALSGQSTWNLTPGYPLLLASTGIVTAVPLLLFAACARRVNLVTLAVMQYLAPIGQFLIGWLVMAEPMPLSRWIGFTVIWCAVAVFAWDAVTHARRNRRAS